MVECVNCIAFSGDRRTVWPIAVSCHTLLNYLGVEFEADVLVVGKQWSEDDRRLMKKVLKLSGNSSRFAYREFQESRYVTLPKFRGTRACYVTLDLPEYHGASRILYLDYDTLPKIDVSSLFHTDLEGHACGAVSWNSSLSNSQEADFFEQLGLEGEIPALNSGVLLIDANQWSRLGISRNLIAFGQENYSRVLGDQTVLNAVLNGNFKQLPWKYNVRLGPKASPFNGAGILHFVGNPKPWASLGRFTHRNYKNWSKQVSILRERLAQ